MERFTSDVWHYFEKIKDNNDLAQCSICQKMMACKGSSTSGLLRHLNKIHNISLTSTSMTLLDVSAINPPAPKKHKADTQQQKSTLTEYQEASNLGEIIARLAAQDGITIRAITRSTFIREAISQKCLTLPNTETEVMWLILHYYEERKLSMIASLSNLIKSNSKFSLTLDEWTSWRNRRYFNVILHGHNSNTYNLGLVFIPRKCGASETRDIVETRLAEFNISFKRDIVAITTDGPNVMKKFGRESPSEMILCMNHAIHQSVIDVLYKKHSSEDDNVHFESVESESESDYYDSDLDLPDFTNEDNFENEKEKIYYDNDIRIRADFKSVLDETRMIIKMFRKSPLNNGILQKYVKTEHGKELSLCLDVKTRWNSIVTMIERFLKIKNSVKKALIDLNLGHKWNSENIQKLNSLLEILNPVKLAAEALSRRDATILTCDAIISVLLNNIQIIQSPIAQEMFEALKSKIEERRDPRIYLLAKYLQNPEWHYQKNNVFSDLPITSKTDIMYYADELMNRLFPDSEQMTQSDYAGKSESDSYYSNVTLLELRESERDKKSFEEQLEEAIASAHSQVCIKKEVPQFKLKEEFQVFEVTSRRTPNLELLYRALLSVKPTCMESERVFSVPGNVATKIRSRLSDKSLNALTFLKALFDKE